MTLEIVNSGIGHGHARHALFDFDGTLSLIREGWQQVMIPLMIEVLRQTPRHEDDAELERHVGEYVTRLTGKDTIFQMMQLAEEVAQRGGNPLAPLAYKRLYLARLWERIKERIAGLKSGRIAPEALLVPGAREFLAALRARGVLCYLASGTDEADVVAEAGYLGLAPYFRSIHGARDDQKRTSKNMVIECIVKENRLEGPELVSFGDGYVEIKEIKRVHGVAVGVASDEVRRTGIDAWKRARLISAGADFIVPDFADHAKLAAYFFG